MQHASKQIEHPLPSHVAQPQRIRNKKARDHKTKPRKKSIDRIFRRVVSFFGFNFNEYSNEQVPFL